MDFPSAFARALIRRWIVALGAVACLLGGSWLAQAQLAPTPTPKPPASPTPRPTPSARPGASPAPTASVEDVMWDGLIFADVAGSDPAVKGGDLKLIGHWPAPLAGRERKISEIFGYRRLRLLGQARERIRSGKEDWVLRSKGFTVKVDTRKPSKKGYEVLVQLFQDEKAPAEPKLLVEATIDLPRTSSPLYIKGPQVNTGQLVIALICGSKDAAWTKPRPRPAIKPTATPTTAAESTPAAPSPNAPEPPSASTVPSPAPTP